MPRPLPRSIEWMPPQQAVAIRAMPLGRQIELAFELRRLARVTIEANVRQENPDFDERQVRDAVTARMVRGNA